MFVQVAAHAESGYEEGEEKPEEPQAPTRNDRQPLPTKPVKFVVGADTLVSANKFSSSSTQIFSLTNKQQVKNVFNIDHFLFV